MRKGFRRTYLFLALAAATLAATVGAAYAADWSIRINSINVSDAGEMQRIEIDADKPLIFTIYKPADPFRAVVELSGADLGGHTERIVVDKDSIYEIIPSQIETPSRMARLEIGLAAPVEINPRVDGNRLILEVPRSRMFAENVETTAAPVIPPAIQPAPKPTEPVEPAKPVVVAAAQPPITPVTPTPTISAVPPTPATPVPPTAPIAAVPVESYIVPTDTTPKAKAAVAQEPAAKQPQPATDTPAAVAGVKPGVSVSASGGRVHVNIATGADVAPEVFDIDKRRIVIDVPGVSIPEEPVPAVSAPVKAVRIGRHKNRARVVIDLSQDAAYSVSRSASGITVSMAAPPAMADKQTAPETGQAPVAVAATQPPSQVAYAAAENGEQKISLDFQDADVVQIYRLLADVGGLNLVVHSDVSGRIPNLKLKNVPWGQALDIVLKLTGHGKSIEGNIMRIAPAAAFAKENEEISKAREAKAKAEDLYQRIVPVNYADAEAIRKAVTDSSILTPRGKITIDSRMNTLIVQDTEDSLNRVADLVKIMDIAKPQVLIEARMVTVKTNVSKTIGIDWSGTFAMDAAHGNPVGMQFPNRMSGSLATNVGLGSAKPSMSLDIGSVADALTLNMKLAAIETNNEGRTLSNPRIMTMDREEAEVKQGTKVPFKTTSQEGTKTEFVDATLSLKVKPEITPGGFIQLTLTATRNAIGVTTPDGVSIDVNEIKTKTLVKDGKTIVIGGIYTKDNTDAVTKIPVLGDLPGVGWLFKSKSRSDEVNELLIFITPRIVKEKAAL
ncbi:MAG: type IV pilus secretin PilQ [Nitrospirae bacterium]|nr:type IV pilus secretin PilQ [Nitrospirota bacterium]